MLILLFSSGTKLEDHNIFLKDANVIHFELFILPLSKNSILLQFSGISGVLFYTPQILEQAGVGILLKNLGIGSDSASILISTLITLLMLPCIVVTMRLMDVSGRR